ncbi:MAG: TolC family protein [Planctomycetes bacterium]|nr:TolC family protein [Planctomycetota bacterium]
MRFTCFFSSVIILTFPFLGDLAFGQQPQQEQPIDLTTALRLAGVDNPEIRLARERVREAVAYRQLAAAQFLPSINMGTNYNQHQGALQTATGEMIKVNRNSLYLGMGAGAVGAGTVNIPGIVFSANLSDAWHNALIRRQVVRQRGFESEAIRNEMLLRVASAYLDVLGAAQRQAIAKQISVDAGEVARVTANFAKAGQGRQADADRAATELEQRKNDLVQADADFALASARLCQLLRLDPSIRLIPMERQVVPGALVPEPIPLGELLAIALTQRPELAARRAEIRAALLQLRNARLLPFSPQVLVGFSAGGFGGGSNRFAAGVVQPDGATLQQPRFGPLDGRTDLDAVLFWSLRNLGVGNVALTRVARSQVRQSELRELATLDRVRAEVASSRVRVLARYAQIEIHERAIKSSLTAFKQDLGRTRNKIGLPIEVLDSLRLLGRSRYGYLESIVDYNRAQFELYVALGQPPADVLARPVPNMSGGTELKK